MTEGSERCRKTLAVIVPFLNEEENLPELYQRVCGVFNRIPERMQLILVDDGSSDGGPRWIEGAMALDSRVELVELSRNFGHQAAITAGLDCCEADAAVVMDADLQDPPEVIEDLARAWRNGGEVVYAVRKRREGETLAKRGLAAAFYRIFSAIVSVKVPMNAGDFRLLDRRVLDALRGMRESRRFMRGLTAWVGFKQVAVEYDRKARHAGATKYPTWKSARLAADAILSFSSSPLRWIVGLGALICVGSLFYAALVVGQAIMYPESVVRGWASLSVVVLLLGGMQLVCIGVVGLYMAQVVDECKRRPLYIVRTIKKGGARNGVAGQEAAG